MPIRLPGFKNTLCQAIRTCGRAQTNDKKTLQVLANVNGVLAASYRAGRGTPVLMVVLGQRDDKHRHIDVNRKKAYEIGRHVEPNTSVDEIQVRLDPLVGVEVKTVVFARFVLPVEDLPEDGLIRSLSFSSLEDQLSISMTGGEFEIKGVVTNYLDWRLVDQKKNVRVDLITHITTRFTEDYLVRLLGLMDSAFHLYVLGKKPNVERSR